VDGDDGGHPEPGEVCEGQVDAIINPKDGIEAGSDRDTPIDRRPAQGGLS